MESTKKDRLIEWIKNPYSIAFLIILALGIAIRLKYLFINGTGIWWDEIGWLQAGQILAGMSPAAFEAAKAPLFPLLESFIFKLGGGENFIRFFLVFIPSIGVMIGAYILGKEIFNKKVGLITMAIVTVFSHHLFYEARIMADMLANCLELLTIALFICFYVNNKKPHLLFIPIILGVFAFLTRYSACISLIVIAIYLLLTERFSLLKNKHAWIAAGAASVILIIFGLINLSVFGNVWPAMIHYITSPISGTAAIEAAHGALNFSFLYAIFDWLNYGPYLLGTGTALIKSLLPLFIIGLSCFFTMFLCMDKILKKDINKKDVAAVNKLKPILVLFLWIAISAYFWIFFWHYATPRWAMGIAPAIFVIAAYGYHYLYNIILNTIDKIKPNKKNMAQAISVIVIGVMILSSLIIVYQRTDRMIDSKAGTYDYLKPTSLWLQDNVQEDELIMFPSYVWYEYYTQRDNFITDYDIKVAAFEPRNLTHLFLEDVPYGLIPTCEYDYEIAMRDSGIDYFVWTIGQQVWTPTTEYMDKAMKEGIFTGYANFNSASNGQPSAWIFKVNKEALNKKIDNLEYENQLLVMVTMEQWGPWNVYKESNNITEQDICGYVYGEKGGKFYGED